jgi:uncharacterized protein YndB with AHSA1/START domain
VQELGHDQVRDRVVDLTREEDDPLLEQAGVEIERALAAGALLDDGRDEDLAHGASISSATGRLHHVGAARTVVQLWGCMSPEDVTREIDLPAAPDEVWRSMTEPEALGEWLEADVELDPRPGGSASFRFADGEMRRAFVRDVEPGRRLAFTWWPLTGAEVGQATTVTITIEPAGAGSRLRLVESPRARTRARAAVVA